MGDLPFTTEQFLQVFAEYNAGIWPAQVVAFILVIILLFMVLKSRESGSSTVNLTLALYWFWMGAVYHIEFFSEINPAAYLFGALFILQGFGFITLIWLKYDLIYSFRKDINGITGGLLVLYALVIYPLLGYLFGHGYPQAPMFGVAPCPTTIFTFGILLWTRGRVPYWLLVIPGLWSVIGFMAAINLTIYEDAGLLVAGILGISLIIYRNQQLKKQAAYRL